MGIIDTSRFPEYQSTLFFRNRMKIEGVTRPNAGVKSVAGRENGPNVAIFRPNFNIFR